MRRFYQCCNTALNNSINGDMSWVELLLLLLLLERQLIRYNWTSSDQVIHVWVGVDVRAARHRS